MVYNPVGMDKPSAKRFVEKPSKAIAAYMNAAYINLETNRQQRDQLVTNR
jgi:hypothetical protein